MSRSNNDTIVNPSTRWFSWKGGEGKLVYYDKEQKKNIDVPMPFTFIVLDELTTITGFYESKGKGVYSNEVRKAEQILRVRCENETLLVGKYADIKEKLHGYGAGFGKSVYIAYKDENNNFKIGNILFTGSSFGGGDHVYDIERKGVQKIGGWLDFSKAFKAEISKQAIIMDKDDRVCTKGATKFFAPKFKLKPLTEDTNNIAIDLDKELQAYLSVYLERTQEALVQPQPQESAPSQTSAPVNSAPVGNQPVNTSRSNTPQEVDPWDAPPENGGAIDNSDDGLPF